MPQLDCGNDLNFWVRGALGCVPDDVWNERGDRLSFVCMATSDGRRLTTQFIEGQHVIVLSERLVPAQGVAEDNWLVRYLYFVVLHEVAHATCDHRPPNEITVDENQRQEDEANALAFEWFNGYLETKLANGLPPFTQHELDGAQQRMTQLMLGWLARRGDIA